MNKNLISKCCKKELKVVGADGATSYWLCIACNKASDPYVEGKEIPENAELHVGSYSEKPNDSNWEKEFDEKFISVWSTRHSRFIRIPDGIRSNIKSFISNLLDKAYAQGQRDLRPRIEKLKVVEVHSEDCESKRKGCDCGYEDKYVHNKTIEEIIKIINQ